MRLVFGVMCVIQKAEEKKNRSENEKKIEKWCRLSPDVGSIYNVHSM